MFGCNRRYIRLLTLISLAVSFNPAVAIEHPPEMVNIPAGSFKQGCVTGVECDPDEKPVHKVEIAPFSIGKYEVTFQQWDECVQAKACPHKPDDSGWGRGDRPVINVSFEDVGLYLKWLSKESGKEYRLPTESEWEFAARAGAMTKYSWGNQRPSCSRKKNNGAKFDGGKKSRCPAVVDGNMVGPAPVGEYKANKWALHDIHGNVWEMTSSCYSENYKSDEFKNCLKRVIRGGAWSSKGKHLRLANRGRAGIIKRAENIGFRVVSKPLSKNELVAMSKPKKADAAKPKQTTIEVKLRKPVAPLKPSKEALFQRKSMQIIKANNDLARKITLDCADNGETTGNQLAANLTMDGSNIITDLYNIAHTSLLAIEEFTKNNKELSSECRTAVKNMESFLHRDHARSLLTEHRANLDNEDFD